jgi:hypothetical protein
MNMTPKGPGTEAWSRENPGTWTEDAEAYATRSYVQTVEKTTLRAHMHKGASQQLTEKHRGARRGQTGPKWPRPSHHGWPCVVKPWWSSRAATWIRQVACTFNIRWCNHILSYFDLLRVMLIHMCRYHMPLVGLDRIMVISLVLRIHRSRARFCTVNKPLFLAPLPGIGNSNPRAIHLSFN